MSVPLRPLDPSVASDPRQPVRMPITTQQPQPARTATVKYMRPEDVYARPFIGGTLVAYQYGTDYALSDLVRYAQTPQAKVAVAETQSHVIPYAGGYYGGYVPRTVYGGRREPTLADYVRFASSPEGQSFAERQTARMAFETYGLGGVVNVSMGRPVTYVPEQSKPGFWGSLWNLQLPLTAGIAGKGASPSGVPFTMTAGELGIMSAIAIPTVLLPMAVPATIMGSGALSSVARIGILAGLGGVSGYATGGPEGALFGGLLGAGLGVAVEGVGYGYAKLSAPKVPSVGLVDVPDIGVTGPRTMSEKVLGLPEGEARIQVRGLKAWEAEATATEMGVAPKTALLDPMAELVEPPTLLRPIAGMPYMPTPELTAVSPRPFTSFVAPAVLAFTEPSYGFEFGRTSQQQEPSWISAPARLTLFKATPERLTPKLADLTDLISGASTRQRTVPLVSMKTWSQLATVQVAKTQTVQSISEVAVGRPVSLTVNAPFLRDDFFRRKLPDMTFAGKKRGARWFAWEFPIRSPKEAWKLLYG